MIDTLLNWLSLKGPYQEITLFLFLGILLGFLTALPWIIRRAGIKKIGKNGLEFDEKNKCSNQTDEEKQKITKDKTLFDLKSNKSSVTTTQDYKMASLILDSFFLSLKEEIINYCQKNGLNEKGTDEYRTYIEEKKTLYFNELKSIFQKEYIAYDILSPYEIDEVIESLKDQTYHKIETLYNRIRDISVKEHELIAKKKADEKERFKIKINEYVKYCASKDNPFSINSILEDHYEENEKLLSCERVDILGKQMEKILYSNDEMKLMYLTTIKDLLNIKLNESINKE